MKSSAHNVQRMLQRRLGSHHKIVWLTNQMQCLHIPNEKPLYVNANDLLLLAELRRLQNDRDEVEDTLPLAQWVHTLAVDDLATKESWKHFSSIDGELETVEDMAEYEILAFTNPNLNSDGEMEVEETIDFNPPTLKDAFSGIQTI
ncbi:unnamed protein product [Hermetia illucens]|uniref:Uncharacterized protein n=1 Tax=Hermetia illucens TaxID=343691 RepID=A0A7R8YZG9_HERIL|nr:unnamed protein product [Hermetia illucens]